jgi:hypothetical protein
MTNVGPRVVRCRVFGFAGQHDLTPSGACLKPDRPRTDKKVSERFAVPALPDYSMKEEPPK